MWSRQPVLLSDDLKPDWRRYVVDFSTLNKSMLQDSPDFIWQLKIQITTAAHFADQQIKVVRKQLWEVLHRALIPVTSRTREDIRGSTRAIGRSLRSLHNFVLFHDVSLRSLAAKHNRRCCHDASRDLVFGEIGKEFTALDSALSRCVVALGDIFSVVRANEEAKLLNDPESATWTAPQTFARNTTKYLVKMQDVMDVKLRILEHLPVLIIGRPEAGIEATISSDFMEKQDSAFITSVYLEDALFQSYHSRLAREDGATLLRVRYYGYYGVNRQPQANEKVFMERKIHHKKWSQEKSIKERFCLRGGELSAFLGGHKLDSGEGKKDEALRTEVQDLLVSGKMKPLVRTIYRRTAFQRSSTNNVRISLDTEVKFWDESGKNEDPVALGWAVLEVKLTGEKPEWVDQLLACGSIQDLDSFSKFLHAVASLHDASGKLEHLPAWFEPFTGGTGDDRGISGDSEDLIMMQQFDAVESSEPDQSKGTSVSSSLPRSNDESDHSTPVDGSEGTPLMGSAKKRQTVEPKTYFANERTFIQWLTAAALLLTFSSTALAASGKATNFGLPIFLVSLLLVGYALMIYHRRLRQFEMGGQVNYSDRWGPSVLAFVLCVAMGGIVFIAMNSAAPLSNVEILPPVAYVERRYARGCLPTPLVMDGMNPDSWEIQQNFPLGDFSSLERRRTEVLHMDSRIRRFYQPSNFTTDWSITVERWCLTLLFPDCNAHFLKYTQEYHQAILKFNNIQAMTVKPKPAADSISNSRFELDSHCHHSKLSYNTEIFGVPDNTAWATGGDAINVLLAKPVYKPREPLHLDHTEFRTHFTWQLPSVGGSPAVVILELVYASSADRLFGRKPTEVTLSTRLYAKTTPLAINHAEGLIEYLRFGSYSRFSGTGNVCAALFVCLLAFAAFGFAYNRYTLGHCWAQKACAVSPAGDELHLYRCLDNPTIFRSVNV